ncbi:MAG TPA: lipid II flippase MurJ [Candidatus Paceibacterota bacterium]
MKRILSFVGREISGLHEAAYLLAGSALASLLFALIRDRLLAHILGASTKLDVYYAAFRVPDLIFVAVAGLVSASVIVPLLSAEHEKGHDALRATVQSLFSSFLVLILVVCAVAWVTLPWIDRLLYPALFARGTGGELVATSRILLLSPILLGLSGFFGSITQVKGRFLVYALATPLYNVGIILGILFFLPVAGVPGLAWGVGLGAALLCIVQIPYLVRDGLFPRGSVRFSWSRIKPVALLSIPRTLTLSSQQLSTLSLVSFASYLGAGSISVFNLAQNLQSVPLSLIGASYSSAAFPVLSKLLAEDKREEYVAKVAAAARHIAFWAIPITVFFIVLRLQIVQVVLGSGQFNISDERRTAAALALFVISSSAQCLQLLFVRSFYAEGKTARPLYMNLICMALTVILGAGLVKAFHAFPVFAAFFESLLRTTGAGDSSVLMLPLAFSVGAFLNLYLHWRSFSREFPSFTRSITRSAFQSIGAAVVGGYLAHLCVGWFAGAFGRSAFGVLFLGLSAGAVGMLLSVVILAVLRNPELRDIALALRSRIWKIDRSSLDRVPS